jgi:hypothetical protein
VFWVFGLRFLVLHYRIHREPTARTTLTADRREIGRSTAATAGGFPASVG